MMKNRIFASLIVAALAASALAGCGDSGSSSAAGGSSAAGTSSGGASSGAASGEPYHVVMAYVANEQADKAKVDAAISDLTLSELNMTFESIQLGYGDYQDKLRLMLSGGDELDVLPVYFTQAAGYINNGQLVDMTGLVKEHGQGIIEQLGEETAMGGSIGGFLYGFPAQKESASKWGIVMRKDVCDELGIDPESLTKREDLDAVFEQVHAAHPELNVIAGTNMIDQDQRWDPLFDNFGVLMMNEGSMTFDVVNLFETDFYKGQAQSVRSWYEKGYVMLDAATTTESTTNLMKAGNLFSYFAPIKPGYLAQEEKNAARELYTAYLETDTNVICSNNVNFFNWGIAQNSKDPVKAMEFLNFAYTSSDFMNLINWGIEGEHWVHMEGSENLITFPEGVDASNNTYNLAIGWELPNQFISYAWEGNPEDIWDQYKAFNAEAWWSDAFGFIYDSSSVSNELTALNNVLTQYQKALNTGSVDVESTLKTMNEQLYAAGLQTVMDEKQKQLDEWAAGRS